MKLERRPLELELVEPLVKPLELVEPLVKPLELVEPLVKPLELVEPLVKPLELVEPLVEPLELVELVEEGVLVDTPELVSSPDSSASFEEVVDVFKSLKRTPSSELEEGGDLMPTPGIVTSSCRCCTSCCGA